MRGKNRGEGRRLCISHTTWASLVAQMVKNPPAGQETRINPWVEKIPWRRDWQSTPVFLTREFHGQTLGLQGVGHN